MNKVNNDKQQNGLYCLLPEKIDPSKKKIVHVSLQFERIGEIDTNKELFFAEIVLKLSWTTDEVINDSYDPNKHWNPKIIIENMFVKPELKIEYLVKDNEITEIQKIKAFFWERLEIENFPLDIQELGVVVTSDLPEVKLVGNRYAVSFKASYTFVEQQRWKLYHFAEVSNKASYDKLKNYQETNKSKLCFKCFCRRKSKYYFLNAFFLIFIVTLTSFNIFSIDCKTQTSRISMAISLLLTSISFKWVYNRSLPTVNYLTSLDKYSIIHILFICLLCVWNSIIATYWDDKTQANQIDKWALIAFALLFALIQMIFIIKFFLFYLTIQKYEKRENEYLKNFSQNIDIQCFYCTDNDTNLIEIKRD